MRYVFEICKWPPNTKLAYLVLYRHRNARTGTAKVEYRTLAEELQVTPKVAVAAIKSLESAGAVVVARKQRTGRHQDANEYKLVPPWEAQTTAERIPSWKRKQGEALEQVSTSQGNTEGELRRSQWNTVSASQGKPQGTEENSPATQAPVVMQAVLPIDGAVFPSGHVTSYEPKKDNGSSSGPAGAEAARKRTPSRSGGEQESNPHGSVAGAIVRQYDVWVKAQTGVGVSSKQWPAVVNMVKNALAGGKAGAPIPHDEAEASFTAALTDDYWRGELLTYGLTTTMLRRIWARSKGGAPAAGGRRGAYVDRHANGPQPGDFSGMRVKEA